MPRRNGSKRVSSYLRTNTHQLLFFDKMICDKIMKSFSSAVENYFVIHDFVALLGSVSLVPVFERSPYFKTTDFDGCFERRTGFQPVYP